MAFKPGDVAPNRVDLTGKRFGRLVAESCLGRGKDGHTWWRCKCDCGESKDVRYQLLQRCMTKSCGCYRRERGVEQGRSTAKHGLHGTAEYVVWTSMRARCSNVDHANYANYGGRGIKVCDRWSTFEAFLQDMGKRPSPKHSIDRRNNDGNYEPSNCRWASTKVQSTNRRTNRPLTLKGRTMPLAAWADELGLGFATLYSRVRRGWSEEKLLLPRFKHDGGWHAPVT